MLSVRARRSAALLARQTALTRAGSIGGVLNGMSGGGLAGGLAGMSSPVLSGAMGMGSGVRYQHAGMTQNVASRMSLTAHGVRSALVKSAGREATRQGICCHSFVEAWD